MEVSNDVIGDNHKPGNMNNKLVKTVATSIELSSVQLSTGRRNGEVKCGFMRTQLAVYTHLVGHNVLGGQYTGQYIGNSLQLRMHKLSRKTIPKDGLKNSLFDRKYCGQYV